MSKPKDEKAKAKIKDDAGGQFVQSQNGKDNSGVSSATPRVLTGDEDATFSKHHGTK
ncbi:MAG: hypothetical protein MEQ84_08790 [Mesorhizobium sp.]|nr:hypothetical protein [Mesorhizobium sp.]